MKHYVDEISNLAREYQRVYYMEDVESMKIKTRVFNIIYEKFEQRAYKLITVEKIPKCDHSVIVSIYTEQILYALEMWKGDSKFTSYLNPCLKGMNRLYAKHKSVVDHYKHARNDSIDALEEDTEEDCI